MAIGDRITVRGRVRTDGAEPVLTRASLRIDGGTPIEKHAARRFVLELEDGERLDVDAIERPGLPAGDRHKGSWGELSATALAKPRSRLPTLGFATSQAGGNN